MKTDIFRVVALTACLALPASAHEAMSGWEYPIECCSGTDCYEIGAADFETIDTGYRIKASGELIAWGDKRVRASGDGRFHRCSYGGKPEAATICFFVPGGA